jgi:IclR family acetate operon transcriptional repressor
MAQRPLHKAGVRRTLTSLATEDNGKFGALPRYPQRHASMNGKAVHDTPAIQSLDRGLAILEAVAASPQPVPLRQLTDLIGIDRSSVFRLANTLRQRRFLAHPKDSKDYILGPTAWRLSRRYGRTVLGTFFHHYLKELTEVLGETSHFAVREGVEVFFIDHQVPAGQVVSVAGQTGEYAPLHCTAHGKVLLADCDRAALAALLGRAPLQVYTKKTVKSLNSLARACAQVRVDGFGFDDGEYIEEVRCVAAPIRDSQGDIVASVGVSSPITRLNSRAMARAAAEVKKTADAISASLAG